MYKFNLKRICAFFTMSVLICAFAFAEKPIAKKIFFFGDSTTGWMAERLQAYGEKNGFEVATLIWDGATMKKYGQNSEKLKKYIASAHPDAVFISLGMNEMATPNPASQLSGSFSKLKSAIGGVPIIWVGPCSWPGKPKWGPELDKWLLSELGAGHYYSSLGLTLPRQSSTNPHPTRSGINKWMDGLVDWLESGKGAVTLPGYESPSKEFSRPKAYTYRKMNAAL